MAARERLKPLRTKPTPNPNLVNSHLDGGSFFWQAGPVGVLLSHGFTATSAEVRPLATVLHQRGYTVAGPLLPGHGSSPEELNRTRWPEWAAAFDEVYRRLAARCQCVFVGGESMGGLLALHHAASHPEIAGVLVYAPALSVQSKIKPLLAPLIAPFVKWQPKPQQTPNPADALWQGYRVNPVAAAAQMFALQRVVRRQLPFIRRPILVIQGRLDPTIDPGVPDFICRRVTSTVKEIHWLENSHHCVVLDAEREQAAALTLQFIERVLSFDEGSPHL